VAKVINIPIDDELDREIEKFRVLNNFKSKKEAIVYLIKKGLEVKK